MTRRRSGKRPSIRPQPRRPDPAVRGRPRGRRLASAVVAVSVVGLGLVAYQMIRTQSAPALAPAIELPHGAADGFNVVLISLDTLRADRVGCYGYPEDTTPAIDALAAGGVRFADAVSVVPMTLPAHASILTGRYPPVHGVRNNGTYRLVADQVTLAERLHAAGYTTAAFIAAFVLDRRYGLEQGFDDYDDRIMPGPEAPGADPLNPQRPGNVVTDSAVRWLEEHHQARPSHPFFVLLHLFDPHMPYSPPEPYKSRYASNPYNGEVAFADSQVARFVDKLRELGLLDKTLVVLVGDHGEGLGDHAESSHSLLIYESTMQVPLIFYAPRLLPEGRVVDDRIVAVVDIEPTILDLLGLEPAPSDGISLLQREVDSDRAVYMETLAPRLNHGWSPLHGLRRHQDKYIKAPTPEYYDLSGDPGELSNLWAEKTAEAARLEARLEELMQSFPTSEDGGEAAVVPDTDALEKLAALGYAGGRIVEDADGLADPKEMIALQDEQLRLANALLGTGRHQQAIPLLEELLDLAPGDASLWALLSTAQARAATIDEAIASRMKSVQLQPRDANGWVELARLQLLKGDPEAALISLDQAEQLEPDLGAVPYMRAQHALRSNDYEEALGHCGEAAKRDPIRYASKAWSLAGRIYELTNTPAEAEAAYRRAYDADPSEAGALWGLARCAERQGRFEQVVQFAGNIPRDRPEWPQSRTMLATAHLQLGMGDTAIQVMREWANLSPRDPVVHNNLGSVFMLLSRFSEAAACFRTALELDPAYERARENLARALEAEADPKSAGGASP